MQQPHVVAAAAKFSKAAENDDDDPFVLLEHASPVAGACLEKLFNDLFSGNTNSLTSTADFQSSEQTSASLFNSQTKRAVSMVAERALASEDEEEDDDQSASLDSEQEEDAEDVGSSSSEDDSEDQEDDDDDDEELGKLIASDAESPFVENTPRDDLIEFVREKFGIDISNAGSLKNKRLPMLKEAWKRLGFNNMNHEQCAERALKTPKTALKIFEQLKEDEISGKFVRASAHKKKVSFKKSATNAKRPEDKKRKATHGGDNEPEKMERPFKKPRSADSAAAVLVEKNEKLSADAPNIEESRPVMAKQTASSAVTGSTAQNKPQSPEGKVMHLYMTALKEKLEDIDADPTMLRESSVCIILNFSDKSSTTKLEFPLPISQTVSVFKVTCDSPEEYFTFWTMIQIIEKKDRWSQLDEMPLADIERFFPTALAFMVLNGFVPAPVLEKKAANLFDSFFADQICAEDLQRSTMLR